MIRLPGLSGPSSKKIYVGFNVGDTCCQISYRSGNDDIETVSLITGAEEYNIPTVLCKREGVNQWFYGKEAMRYASEESDGILIDNLLSLAKKGDAVIVDKVPYQPESLLALFIKRCMSLISAVFSDKMAGVLFTADNMTYDNIAICRQAVKSIGLKAEKIYFQSHSESFYHFLIRQSDDIWRNGSVLFEYSGGTINAYRMESNFRTDPIVSYITESRYETLGGYGLPLTEDEAARRDREFLDFAKRFCESGNAVSVYLVGDGFDDSWMQLSKKYLLGNYRVFQGSNLFSKGACYGILDRMVPDDITKRYLFLGNDKLSCNVGMKVFSQGDEKYYAILDAGTSWYDARRSFEYYIQDGDYIELILTSLTGGGERVARITFDEFSGKITRFRTTLYMENESVLTAETEDLGFGEFRPSTGRVWREEIPVS